MGNSELLNLLIEAVVESGPYVLASPEDAEYFRHGLRQELRKSFIETKNALPPKTNFSSPPLKPVVKPVQQFVPPPKPIQPVPNETPKPALTEPIKTLPTDFSLLRHVLSLIAPQLAIINEIPSDATARKIAERWKTKNQTAPISLLLYQEPPEQKSLLEEIALALDIYFGPAKIVYAETIEKEKQWEAFLSVADLKTIIVCDYTLWQLNGLMHFYKETPATGVRTLKNVPLFLLPDLSLYLKDPLLKRSLWKALCQKFS